jgi:hypothetical protein
LPVSFDNIVITDKARILLYKKNENHNLLSEIKGNFQRDYNKFISILERFGNFGVINDETKYRRISGNTFEFKINKLRVFCVKLEGAVPITIVLNHYYKKQKQRMPNNERDKAIRLSEEITTLFNQNQQLFEE